VQEEETFVCIEQVDIIRLLHNNILYIHTYIVYVQPFLSVHTNNTNNNKASKKASQQKKQTTATTYKKSQRNYFSSELNNIYYTSLWL
jgi:hypothetical protein